MTTHLNKGAILRFLRTMASFRRIQSVRVIDRAFYLDNKNNFGAALKDIFVDEARNYESSMVIFMMDELLG